MDLAIKIAVFAIIAQVFLTLLTFMRMGQARMASLATGKLHMRDIALSNDAWGDEIKKLTNNLQNQFETPILLYAGVVLVAALSISNWIIAGTAVAYVGLRILHHIIHTGKNHVPSRYKVFGLGLLALAVMWITILVEVIRL